MAALTSAARPEEFPVERFDQIGKGADREPLAFQVVAEHSVR